MFLRTWTTTLLTLTAVLLPAVAFGEAGDGLQTGNLSVSPSLTGGVAWSSNVFRQSTEERSPISAPSLTISPALSVSSLTPDVVNFTLDGSATWEQYLGGTFVTAQSGLSADVGAGITFNQEGAVSFRLEDRLQRTNEPPWNPATFAYNRTVNRLGATVGLHPGGKVFQHFFSYDWSVVLHDELPDLNRQLHDFTLSNHWRFLPRTAVVLVGDYQLIRYNQPTRLGGAFPNVNSNPLRVSAGISGLVTNRLSLRLMGGWGWGFYGDSPSFTGLVVDTQAAYAFGVVAEKNRMYLGYQRNFQDASIANYAQFHRPYAGYNQTIFNDRLSLSLRAEMMIRDYVGAPSGSFDGPGGQVAIDGDLGDLLVSGGVGVGYNIRKWWSVGARYGISANFTDDVVVVTESSEDVVREYVAHRISLVTTIRY